MELITEVDGSSKLINSTLVNSSGVSVVERSPKRDDLEGSKRELDVEGFHVQEVHVEVEINIGPEGALDPGIHNAVLLTLLNSALETITEVDIVVPSNLANRCIKI